MDLPLLNHITTVLDVAYPVWRTDIEHFRQERAVKQRRDGRRWTDEEVVEGLVLAILSQQVAWRRIEEARTRLPATLAGYRLDDLRQQSGDRIYGDLRGLGLGSQSMGRIARSLPETARALSEISAQHGSLDNWLCEYPSNPVGFIRSIGTTGGAHKLSMVGIAIACEFLKNVGFAEFKPDAHLCRLFSGERLGIVPTIRNANQPSDSDRLAVRQRGLEWADAVGWSPVVLDNALWMFCARGYAQICRKNPQCWRCPVPSPPCRAPERT